MPTDYPKQLARTRSFTIGMPHHFRPTADGALVLFLRAVSGSNDLTELWALDPATGLERRLVDPRQLDDGSSLVSPHEQARRERIRAFGSGIVDFVTSANGRVIAFTLGGKAWVHDVSAGTTVRALTAPDPQGITLSPDGKLLAYSAGGGFHVTSTNGGASNTLIHTEDPAVRWGVAEFAAAEELDRFDGAWWSPDSDQLLVARVDESAVPTWQLTDPADPAAPARTVRYPHAGSDNADVSLWLINLNGTRARVLWNRADYEYLARVHWAAGAAPVVQVLSRDQKAAQVLSVDGSGRTRLLDQMHDPDWIEILAAPRLTPDGALIQVQSVEGRTRVTIDGNPLRQDDLQVGDLLAVEPGGFFVSAYRTPQSLQIYRLAPDASPVLVSPGHIEEASVAGGLVVARSGSLKSLDQPTTVRDETGVVVAEISDVAENPGILPNVQLLESDERGAAIAVILPQDHDGSGQLPIVMHPYGGPHRRRVIQSSRRFLEDQWLADQGFCVVIADGRGMLGHDGQWERAIAGDLAGVPLEDQIDALQTVARVLPVADMDRVGILGWSFGGFLAGIAVLDRPDLFHVGVIGAAVSDWRLYNTCYTERYLGHPADSPALYDANSLISRAGNAQRPLLVIHGLVDDNVIAANSLRLSARLLTSNYAPSFLPLPGVAHMTPQADVSSALWHAQVRFLKDGLTERARELSLV